MENVFYILYNDIGNCLYKIKIKSYEKVRDTNDYNAIYVSKEDYIKLKSDYIANMK